MSSASHTSWPLSWISRWHHALVFQRRARVLAELLAAQIPPSARVLDIGCGDGTISATVARLRPDVSIEGLDVLVRPGCQIPCSPFDGSTLPFSDDSFDVCVLVDVLHHTDDMRVLLREARRVTRSFVLLKDHLDENVFDDAILRFMDWVGNRPHGVRLTYNYQSRAQWLGQFSNCGLCEVSWSTRVPLYAVPFSLVAGRGLHFVCLLKKVS